MKAIVTKGRMTEKELKDYIDYIKKVYGFRNDEIVIVDNNKEAYKKVIEDIKKF